MSDAVQEQAPARERPQEKVPWIDNHKLARNHAEIWKFIKFAVFSIGGAAPEMIAFFVFKNVFRAAPDEKLGVFAFLQTLVTPEKGYTLAGLIIAVVISTFIGQTFGFFINRKATFSGTNSNLALSYFLQVLLIIFTICANSIVSPVLIGLVHKVPFLSSGLADFFGKWFSMIATTAWLYPANRFLIHRKKKETNIQEEEPQP